MQEKCCPGLNCCKPEWTLGDSIVQESACFLALHALPLFTSCLPISLNSKARLAPYLSNWCTRHPFLIWSNQLKILQRTITLGTPEKLISTSLSNELYLSLGYLQQEEKQNKTKHKLHSKQDQTSLSHSKQNSRQRLIVFILLMKGWAIVGWKPGHLALPSV